MPVSPRAGDFRKLDMDSADDVALLRHYYEKSNPFSPLRVEHNFGLLMFYCSAFMKHFVITRQKMRQWSSPCKTSGADLL
ncbi:putative GNAT-family acetyltransferase [Klebsiella variicola]|uniref:Putative GNAT-family acetyltransferase n=1 Tax=Klebsiella variicola TaxID=244366 RepID=A0A7H4MEZ0_KLEVA|nr:putative GNAT-family acetyltransferase [Klebsiella variicola]